MHKILSMVRVYLIQALRTPIVVIMAFVMPLIFTAALGAAFAPDDPNTDLRHRLVVVDEAGGARSRALVALLGESSVVRMEELAALPPDLAPHPFVLILPSGWETAETPAVQLSAAEPGSRQALAVQQEIRSAAARAGLVAQNAAIALLLADEVTTLSAAERAAWLAEAEQQAQAAVGALPVKVVSEVATEGDAMPDVSTMAGNFQSSPGSLVNFGLVTLLAVAIFLVEERTNGTLRRLLASPVQPFVILLGKIMGPFALGLLQTALLVAAGQWLFGVPWGRSPLALALLVVAFNLSAVALGILISTLVRTTQQATAVMLTISMSMAALGGAWWPSEITPPAMQTAGKLLPSGWAMEGFKAVILRGAGVDEVWLPVTVLFGFAALFLALGTWRFRFE